jgi:hypothetical protein
MIMRVFTSFFLLLILSVTANAQLFIKDNSYVFNKGTLVFVKDYVNVDGTNSNFYLRNEGQLLQGSTAAGVGLNKGLGNLSVFQEGTSNNYGYNYWCSPVGVPTSTSATNTPFGIGQIKRPTGTTSYGGQSITPGFDGTTSASSLVISSRWIYKYIVSNQYSNWNYVGTANTIAPGEGFTMKGVLGNDTTDVGELLSNNPGNNQRYDFRGIPNEGTIDIQVNNVPGPNYSNTTLTGNPYPSAININLFLLENSGYIVNYTTGAISTGGPVNVIDGKSYYWEHIKPATSHYTTQYIGGYGYYVPNGASAFSPGTYNNATWNTYNADGTPNTVGSSTGTERYKRMFAPIGQGFMIAGTTAGYAKMKNQYRVFVKESVGNNSQFERNSNNSTTGNIQNWDDIPNVAGVNYTQFSKAEVPQLKIHTVFNDEFTREITLAFNPNTTDGFDTAMDASSNETLTNDAYFPLNNVPHVISTLPFNIDKRIPISFKIGTQSTIKFFVGGIINFDGSNEVYLYDDLTGIYHDIKNDFYETLLPVGVYDNRFQITFKNSALAVSNTIKNSFSIVQNNMNQLLSISNPNGIEVKSVALYDVLGKLIFDKTDLGVKTLYEFPTISLSEGIYIIKLKTIDGQSVSQKVIIEKQK